MFLLTCRICTIIEKIDFNSNTNSFNEDNVGEVARNNYRWVSKLAVMSHRVSDSFVNNN